MCFCFNLRLRGTSAVTAFPPSTPSCPRPSLDSGSARSARTMSDGEDRGVGDDVSVESIDSVEQYINFESIRNDGLEEAIGFSWPGIYEDNDGVGSGGGNDEKESAEGASGRKLRKIVISTLLEEDDLAPLFDGSRWAGTRLWGAAVRCIQYITGELPDANAEKEMTVSTSCGDDRVSLLELGCGLGVPGMIYHLLGGDVVLTDQANILSQLEKNVRENFPDTAVAASIDVDGAASTSRHTIQAMPLSWSRGDINGLLQQLGRSNRGFDVVINCDCVYEPLYGMSWHLLNETIDELLKVNPDCIVVSSMERRAADGIDNFLEEMRNMEHVASVEKVWFEEGRQIEIYLTRGCSTSAS